MNTPKEPAGQEPGAAKPAPETVESLSLKYEQVKSELEASDRGRRFQWRALLRMARRLDRIDKQNKLFAKTCKALTFGLQKIEIEVAADQENAETVSADLARAATAGKLTDGME
jgi:hypothetical protein